MANGLSAKLLALLTAMNLGKSTNHPLAGWQVLNMLYHDGSKGGEPITMGYLTQHYNADYLQPGEKLVDDSALRLVVKILVEQAHLVEVSTRKVRERMQSGKFHIIQSAVYHINAAGIEYLKAMQRVVEAENTVVASTKRIQEYCDLVAKFKQYAQMTAATIDLYEDFNRFLSAYEDVINGLRKLDVDLHEISTDLAFDRMGQAAVHLQQMLHEQAIPAYSKMRDQSGVLLWLTTQPNFAKMVAASRQASGNLDAAVAIGDQSALEVERAQTADFVTRQLQMMVRSFDPSPTAIQTSFDSIYLLYETLADASNLLAREYEHVQRQSVDVHALTADIDALLKNASRIFLPEALPAHLPMDRLIKSEMARIEELPSEERADALAELTDSVRRDMLEAGTMGPVTRQVSDADRQPISAADNPQVAQDQDLAADDRTAMAEFAEQVMVDGRTARVTQDLEFKTALARDTLIGLYPAVMYTSTAGFAAFGRGVAAAKVLGQTPVHVHLRGEAFAAVLPHGFEITFEEGS